MTARKLCPYVYFAILINILIGFLIYNQFPIYYSTTAMQCIRIANYVFGIRNVTIYIL